MVCITVKEFWHELYVAVKEFWQTLYLAVEEFWHVLYVTVKSSGTRSSSKGVLAHTVGGMEAKANIFFIFGTRKVNWQITIKKYTAFNDATR